MAYIRISLLAACGMLACMMIVNDQAMATISCGQVIGFVKPCRNYIQNKGALTIACCSGVKAVDSIAKTTPDRQTACRCVKNAVDNTPGLNGVLLSSLPGKCGVVTLPFKISLNMHCSKVK